MIVFCARPSPVRGTLAATVSIGERRLPMWWVCYSSILALLNTLAIALDLTLDTFHMRPPCLVMSCLPLYAAAPRAPVVAPHSCNETHLREQLLLSQVSIAF